MGGRIHRTLSLVDPKDEDCVLTITELDPGEDVGEESIRQVSIFTEGTVWVTWQDVVLLRNMLSELIRTSPLGSNPDTWRKSQDDDEGPPFL